MMTKLKQMSFPHLEMRLLKKFDLKIRRDLSSKEGKGINGRV